jgi:GDP-4-dehydro-6-deoxy-D-mannose reductase
MHQRAAGIEENGVDRSEDHGAAAIAHGSAVWQPAAVRVFVTGASGFVGRHLSAHLCELGHEVIGTDRELDVSDPAVLAPFVARTRPEAIIHLAAVSSVAASQADPNLAFRVNFFGTHTLLEAAIRHAPRARVLLVGSGEVYGAGAPDSPPFTEASSLRPRSSYATTKAAADLLGLSYADRGLAVVRVRPFNHTGAGQSDAFVASSFARQLVEIERGQRPDVLHVGNLASVRDFLDVADVVSAYARLCDVRVPATAYNVASGRGVSAGELLETLCGLAKLSPRIEVDPARLRPADRSVGDASRLRAAAGWAPQIPLEATLAGLLAHWRAELSAA